MERTNPWSVTVNTVPTESLPDDDAGGFQSEFEIRVVRLGPIVPHPNADTLGVTHVGGPGGYPVVVKLGQYKEGDLAVYVPVDAEVPENDPRWTFLGKHTRVRAARFRGVFSMGLLTPAEPGWAEGDDVAVPLGIARWVPKRCAWAFAGADDTAPTPPGLDLPPYGVRALRRWPEALLLGEEVVLTEKIHGTSARFALHEGKLVVGTRTRWIRPGPDSPWGRAVAACSLERAMARLVEQGSVVVYGEVFGGGVQDLDYGYGRAAVSFRVFDLWDRTNARFVDHDGFVEICEEAGLPTVPVLYRGPWSPALTDLAEGPSKVGGPIREGWVARPIHERSALFVQSPQHEPRLERVVLKYHGEGYLTRHGGRR